MNQWNCFRGTLKFLAIYSLAACPMLFHSCPVIVPLYTHFSSPKSHCWWLSSATFIISIYIYIYIYVDVYIYIHCNIHCNFTSTKKIWNHPEYTGESNHLTPIFFFQWRKGSIRHSSSTSGSSSLADLEICRPGHPGGARHENHRIQRSSPPKKRIIHRMYGKIMINFWRIDD